MAENLINFVHLLATAVWLGGALFIKIILDPASRAIDPRENGKLQAVVAKRFSIAAWISIVLLVITGISKTPSGMLMDTTSEAGIILALKHILIIGVIGIGLAIGLVVVPRLRRSAGSPEPAVQLQFQKAGRQLQRLSMTSTVLGIGILLAASFLW